MDLRNLLFTYRSFTPVPIVLAILYFSDPSVPFIYFGLGLVSIGEFIRINAVQYAGGATRTTKVGAPSLCTAGPYAITRNPLYLGNMIIYCGISLIAGGQFMWELLLIVFAVFSFQYSMIISLEEDTLIDLFGNEYELYRNNVPRLFPRLSPWHNQDFRKPTPFLKTLKIEKRTLQNISLMLFILFARYYWGLSA
jgi:protein-S-isoprenylcysteine O-methyltransferase Ste14